MTPEELKKLAAYLRSLAERITGEKVEETDDHFVAGALEGLAEGLEMRTGEIIK